MNNDEVLTPQVIIPGQNDDQDPELARFIHENAYVCGVRYPNGQIGCVHRTIFQWRLLIGGFRSVSNAFCYATFQQAMVGLIAYEPPAPGELPDPPGGWHKSVTDGRVRPGGHRDGEYVAR